MSWLSSRRHALLQVAVLLVFPLLSCIETESVICPSGRICGPGFMCALNEDTCIATPCGDGVLQEGEKCDDGNVTEGDGCNSTCTSTATCGDNLKDPLETCDDGNTQSGDGCSADCLLLEFCGNSHLNFGERCDDGNIQSGDGCSADCLSIERCGNGILDIAAGEVCDDGNTQSRDGCSADCQSKELCGNSYLDSAMGEKCDDGNTQSGDGCSANCLSIELCGNKYIDTDQDEVCDDGNNKSGDGCSADCKFAGVGCGNDYLDPGEECDDGDRLDNNDCRNNCRWARCGDGVAATAATNTSLREECDDGNGNNEDDCLNSCRRNICGDGFKDLQGAEVEVCDDGNQITEMECTYGVRSCTICQEDCKAQFALSGPICGDGIVNGPEACDDGNNLSCGTCDETCTQAQRARATGRIRPVIPTSIGDSQFETFSLNDGINNIPVIFEFDKDNRIHNGHIKVDISSATSISDVADAIKSAIIGASLQLQIHATLDGSDVVLTHDEEGSFGNQLIVESVNAKGFTVRGMSGGMGYDCPAATPCRQDADCLRGLVCSDNLICEEPPPPPPVQLRQ